MASTKKPSDQHPATNEQDDDTLREEQQSHGTQQNRSKKEGHATQIGSGQDQQSGHSRGGNQPGTKR